jgi:hypothetical protein
LKFDCPGHQFYTLEMPLSSFQFRSFVKVIAPLVPYITVGPGLLVFHNAWAAILSYHLAMLVVMMISGRSLSIALIVRGGDKLRLPLLTAAGVIGGLLLWLLKPWILVNNELALFTQSIGLTAQTWPFFMAYFVIFSPALEELYWRNYLGSLNLKPHINDFWFAGYHIIVLAGKIQTAWLIAVFLILAAAAWTWRQSNRLGEGLLPSFASHLAADASIILVSFFLIIQ